MIIRVIDFETTGVPEDEGGAAICEVGWCDIVQGQTTIGPPVAYLSNPGRPMPVVAQAVHHISDADVALAPPPDGRLAQMMTGPPSYFAAHNAKFEQAFFGGGDVPWICTYKVAVRLWPDAPSHSNQVLRYWLGIDLGDEAMPPHRAGPDAYITAHLLARMLADGRASIDDMVRWSSGPPLLPKINFGKHRGARWEDVPSDYLRWIVNKSDLDGDTKANARHHLKCRDGVSAQQNGGEGTPQTEE